MKTRTLTIGNPLTEYKLQNRIIKALKKVEVGDKLILKLAGKPLIEIRRMKDWDQIAGKPWWNCIDIVADQSIYSTTHNNKLLGWVQGYMSGKLHDQHEYRMVLLKTPKRSSEGFVVQADMAEPIIKELVFEDTYSYAMIVGRTE